jgi:hypothetical protein
MNLYDVTLVPFWPCDRADGGWFLLILEGLLVQECILVSSNSLCQDVTGYKLKHLGGLVAGGHSGTGTFLALWPCGWRVVFAYIARFACSRMYIGVQQQFMPGCDRLQA